MMSENITNLSADWDASWANQTSRKSVRARTYRNPSPPSRPVRVSIESGLRLAAGFVRAPGDPVERLPLRQVEGLRPARGVDAGRAGAFRGLRAGQAGEDPAELLTAELEDALGEP